MTAQGRVQQRQHVPIAVTAISGDGLQERNLTTIEPFAPQTAGVRLAGSPFQRRVAIRGLGSTGGNIGFERSAPMALGGVVASRGGPLTRPIFDTEGVGVVEGPQSRKADGVLVGEVIF